MDLTKYNKNINNKGWDDRVFSISYPIMKIRYSLKDFGLNDKTNKIRDIKSMGNFILKDSELFSKYSYFITDLLDLFADLISHLDDEDYKKYYIEFNTKFNEFEKFFFNKIYYSTDKNKEDVFTFTCMMWA